MAEQQKSVLDHLISLLTVGVVLSAAALIGIYVYIFGTDLSRDHEIWSDFGSYVGGLIGPLVSFAALVAIIKTIQLQRQILDRQKSEFESLIRLQERTFEAQSKQLEIAIAVADGEKISNYKLAVLRMVEQQIAYYTNKVESGMKGTEMMLRERAAIDQAVLGAQLKDASERLSVANARLNGLNEFAMEFGIKQHESVDAVQKHLREGLLKAFER